MWPYIKEKDNVHDPWRQPDSRRGRSQRRGCWRGNTLVCRSGGWRIWTPGHDCSRLLNSEGGSVLPSFYSITSASPIFPALFPLLPQKPPTTETLRFAPAPAPAPAPAGHPPGRGRQRGTLHLSFFVWCCGGGGHLDLFVLALPVIDPP